MSPRQKDQLMRLTYCLSANTNLSMKNTNLLLKPVVISDKQSKPDVGIDHVPSDLISLNVTLEAHTQTPSST